MATAAGKRHSDIAYDDEKSDFYGTLYAIGFCAHDVYSSAFYLRHCLFYFREYLSEMRRFFPHAIRSFSFYLVILSHFF